MENFIIINHPENLNHWTRKFQGIYFGNEFCPRLLPSKEEINAVVNFIKKKSLKLTLLTPQADSNGLETIKEAINYLAKNRMLNEVVANDYGVLHYVRKKFPHSKVILGRMLSGFYIGYSGPFLRKIGIQRLEFDNLNLVQFDKLRSIEHFSFYYPYFLFYASRYCPVAGIFHNRSVNPGIIECSRECLKIGELKTYGPLLSRAAVLKGNAQFIKRRINLKNLKKLPPNINRLVFQPGPPV